MATPLATKDDIIAIRGLAQLELVADRDGDGFVDDDAVDRELAAGSDFAMGYVRIKYPGPLPEVPMSLVRAVVDLAIYGLATGPGGGLTEDIEKRREHAVKWLIDLSTGRATLGFDESVDPPDQDAEILTSSNEQVFSRSSLRGLV